MDKYDLITKISDYLKGLTPDDLKCILILAERLSRNRREVKH